MNMTYQEVPILGISDDEETKTDNQGALRGVSEVLPKLVYDESLFLDKIKEFIPNPSMQNNNNQPSIIPEEEAIDEFEITKVEQG